MAARRLAIGGALLAVVAALAQLSDVDGPWTVIIIVSALLALLGTLRAHPSAPARHDQVRAEAKSTESQQHVEQLRAEIESHKRLERELVMAKQVAEAATMSKGEFLATMSHEIRTPLNGIIPLLDLLLSSPMPPDQRDYVQTAFGSAKQLLRIVDDILDYSKLDANRVELETVGLNLKDLLESVLRLMDKAAEAKGLKLALTIDPAVRLAVRGDSVRLRQILTNLLSNAIKFTERGGVTLNVTRRAETRNQHELRFEVRDTGVGIAPEIAARLFRPFSQADASTTRTYGGTGLGLVICKRIVDLMGGQIGVESDHARGSLFWFQIPMLKAHGDIGERKRDIHGARVLLVTANAAQQRRFALALPSWGAMYVHASNTQEAIAKLRAAAGRSNSWSFDLLLVDGGAIPATVLALHRSVLRDAALEDLRVLYLRSDEDLPREIAENERVRIGLRDSTDAELRQLITRMLEEEVRPAPTPAPAPVTATRISALAPDAPLRGHVLLVEDNPVNRQVAQRLLTLAGLSTDSAENGREAVDKIAAHRYDAVLMDCQMPLMDGYSATRHIRATETEYSLPHLPIIAMTANAMVGDREKCLACGMDDYLSKPLNRALLEDTLRRWLPAVPAGDAIVAPATPALAPSPSLAAALPAEQRPMSAAELIAAVGPGAARHAPARPEAPRPAAPPAAAPATLEMPRPTLREMMQARSTAATPATPSIPATPSTRVAPTLASPRPPAPAARVPPPAAARGNGAATAPAVSSAVPVLNREIVDDLREIMGEEFVALVRVFLEDAPQALHKLQLAADTADVDGLVGPAHSLKSTSANLGALSLSDIARTIEHGARQRTLDDPAHHVAALGREFHRVEAALRGFLG